MFTLKLYICRNVGQSGKTIPEGCAESGMQKAFSTKIIEASEVDVHILRPGELAEVAVKASPTDIIGRAFYIADRCKPRPQGFSDEIDFYYEAIVENSAGKTTQIINPDRM